MSDETIDLGGPREAEARRDRPAYKARKIAIYLPSLVMALEEGGDLRMVRGLPRDARLVKAEVSGGRLTLTVASEEYPEAAYGREPEGAIINIERINPPAWEVGPPPDATEPTGDSRQAVAEGRQPGSADA